MATVRLARARAQAPYNRRRPEDTVLYQVVAEHLETFLAEASEHTQTGLGYPKFVEKEFRAYLRCGILAYGFARVVCTVCKDEDLVGFSCKKRGLCPSCQGRRMADVAAHLVDHVLPEARYRQWTLSLPKRIRFQMAKDPKLLRDVRTIGLRKIFAYQRRKARELGVKDGRPASVSFTQRFGSSLNFHIHWHHIVGDCVFAQNEDGSVRVVDLPEPSTAEVEKLVVQIATAVEKRVAKEKPSSDEFEDDEDAVMVQALFESMHTHLPSEPPSAKPKPNPRPRCAFVEGYSLDANVSAGYDDRPALERLLRYGARPAFSHKRLELTASGKVAYRLRRASHTGQTHVVLEPLAFLKRLATLIPPPRQNLITYRGCFAPNAKLRRAVVALCPVPEDDEPKKKAATSGESTAELSPEENTSPRSRTPWAQLLKRVFHNDLLVCEKCNGKRKVIAFVTESKSIQKILTHLGLPADPPTISPARALPQTEMFDDPWDTGAHATDAP